jgi:hypothetical protein
MQQRHSGHDLIYVLYNLGVTKIPLGFNVNEWRLYLQYQDSMLPHIYWWSLSRCITIRQLIPPSLTRPDTCYLMYIQACIDLHVCLVANRVIPSGCCKIESDKFKEARKRPSLDGVEVPDEGGKRIRSDVSVCRKYVERHSNSSRAYTRRP